jgi:hypothetical protein
MKKEADSRTRPNFVRPGGCRKTATQWYGGVSTAWASRRIKAATQRVVLSLVEWHMITYARVILKLGWQRWTWGGLISPSAHFRSMGV